MKKQVSEIKGLKSNHKREGKKMRCFIDKKRLPFFGVLIALVLIMTPVVAVAGGGPEPGASCPGDWKYGAPPYMGDVTAELVVVHEPEPDQFVVVSGTLEQVGNSACIADLEEGVRYGAITSADFQSLKPGNLRMTCLQNFCTYTVYEIGEDAVRECLFPCLGDSDYLEVVGVGKMKWIDDMSFTAQFIIMPLE